MTSYHSFSKEKFEEELPQGFKRKTISSTKEYVYDFSLSENFVIRIHSSVDRRNDMSRKSGDDAIRVSLYHLSSDSIIGYDSRTHRILDENGNPRWPKNMRKKIEKLKSEWKDHIYDCPECDGYLRKIDVNGGFFGCSNYPNCEFSTGMDENEEPILDEAEKSKWECPSCEDGNLRKREYEGDEFIGCSNYPDCQFSCDIDENGEPNYDEKDVEKANEKKEDKSKWDRVREFLESKKDESDFHKSLLESLNEYGQLTDNQMDCIEDEVEIFHNGASSLEKFPLEDELTDDEERLLKRFGMYGEGYSC